MIVLGLHPSTESINKDLRSLINLRHLILPLEVIPTIAEIGKLTSLQNLDEFHVREGNGYKIGELKHLRELHGELRIKNLENVRSYEDALEAELLNKKHLHSLLLQWDSDSNSTPEVAEKVIDGLQPHSSLENLEIIGYSGALSPCRLETQDLAMLEFITSITLSNCKNLQLLPPLEKLPFLKFLSLANMRALTEVGHSFRMCDMVTAFPRLEVLNFSSMPHLEKWCGVEDGPWFPCLKDLYIEDCSGLVALRRLPHSLERLETSNVGLITLPRLWQCQNNDCKNRSRSNLHHLMLWSCPKLTSLARGLLQHTDHFMDVEELIIDGCKELVHLPVEGFQKLVSLRSLKIRKCPRLQRHNAPRDDFFLPSSVQNISMEDCGEIDASLPGAMEHLAYLSELTLSECTSITSLPSAEVCKHSSHSKRLEIRECPKLAGAVAAAPPLTSDPAKGAAVGSSLSLDILEVDDPSLLHLEPLRSLASIQHVELLDCSQLTSLPEEWLSQVRSSLQRLRLCKAVSLRFLPVSLKQLSSLRELELDGFPLLQSLPEMPNSLKTLCIRDCDSKLEDHLLGQDWNRIANWNSSPEICQAKIFSRNEAHRN
uniref:Probable disease resistance protein At4g19520 n=2 Tax=Elaeis guineensis var. tenera TaxID=51953 RepID=A0A8N4ICK7_ELAGV|nr:probable disease resistance protein At4g19520 [Elaeis guineensis]